MNHAAADSIRAACFEPKAMKIQIINGANLNLLGKREPHIYGSQTFEDYFEGLKTDFPEVGLFHFQSNIEGEIIDCIQRVGYDYDFIILNAGGYTHTSVSIADALSAVPVRAVEVHISNIFAREEYRQTSLIAPRCVGSISGFGLNSYKLAIEACKQLFNA
jgi:3-dehydroquinate dehydratase-2